MRISHAALGALSLTAAVILAAAGASATAQTPPAAAQGAAPASTESDSPLRRLLDDSVEWFEFVGVDDAREKLKPLVALRWTNNARASVDGQTVIWIADNGRPEAIAAIYPFEDRFCTEFDSLSRGTTFQASRQGKPFWQPQAAGLEFAAVERAPEPAATAGGRLLQMKGLARRFRATMLGWRNDGSLQEELRLLPRPLFQYKTDPQGEIIDGALFAFASGTDPEAVLVIEAVRQAGKGRYEYAFVRRTSGGLEARYGDAVVWRVGPYPNGTDPRGVHRGSSEPLAPLLAERK